MLNQQDLLPSATLIVFIVPEMIVFSLPLGGTAKNIYCLLYFTCVIQFFPAIARIWPGNIAGKGIRIFTCS